MAKEKYIIGHLDKLMLARPWETPEEAPGAKPNTERICRGRAYANGVPPTHTINARGACIEDQWSERVWSCTGTSRMRSSGSSTRTWVWTAGSIRQQLGRRVSCHTAMTQTRHVVFGERFTLAAEGLLRQVHIVQDLDERPKGHTFPLP